MKNKIFTAFVVFSLFTGVLFARGNQELVPAGHWIYDNVKKISMEQGITNFADCAPLSIQELKIYMSEISREELSDSGKFLYDQINEFFDYTPIGINADVLSLGIEPSVNVSAFYKSSEDIDWVYDRYERKPLADVLVTAGCADYVSMGMDVYLAQNKNTALSNDRYTNIPLSADDIDINFPDTTYFSAGFKPGEKTGIGFIIGKGARNIGDTLTGSMIWSQYLTGVSYAQLTAYAPNLKYTGVVSQFNVDRYMYTHQVDIRLFKKFSLTALEGIFVNAPVELRFLNPFTIFHGMAPWREYEPDAYDPESHTCAYLGVKFQFVPVKNLRFYGLYAMTQFQTTYELKNYESDTTPNGIGGQLGSEYYLNLSKGRLRFALEGSYAQPYLYIKESPNWTLVRTYCENMGNKRYPFYEWIGSPFGPDTISGEVTAGYEIPEKWSVDFIWLFLARGEMSGRNVFDSMKNVGGNYSWGGNHLGEDYPEDWCYPEGGDRMTHEEAKRRQSLVTPTGTAEYVNRLSLRGIFKFNKKIEGCVQGSYVYIMNHNHTEGETARGIEAAMACSIKF